MTVAAILKHKGHEVASVAAPALVAEVAALLSARRIGAVLVLDATGQILGIVSERDIVRSLAANGARTLEMTAGQLMTRVLHTVSPRSTEVEAMEKMTANRVRHLPVLDRGALVGMISIGDVVKARIMQQDSEVETVFVWIGGTDADVAEHRERARIAGVADHVRFLGEREDTPEIFAGLDLFVLPSREDPFPLVMLESACYGVPTVAFSGSGGAGEFIEDDAGILVPSGDLDGMARALDRAARDSELRSTMGDAARRKVHERHDLGHAGRQIFAIIDAVAATDPR